MNSPRTLLIVAVTIILFAATGYAQSGKQHAASPRPVNLSSDNVSSQNSSVKEQLQNFKHDPSNPELSNLKLNLLELQVQMEKAKMDNSLSASEMEGLSNRINMLQSKIKAMTYVEPVQENIANTSPQRARPAKPKEVVEKEILVSARETKRLSREQFMQLGQDAQKEMLNDGMVITDLINNNAETLGKANPNPIFIIASDFTHYSIEKQIQILNNPQTYIVVQHSSQIPGKNTDKQEPELTKYKISKAELNQYSPERRKAIENSPNFTITD